MTDSVRWLPVGRRHGCGDSEGSRQGRADLARGGKARGRRPGRRRRQGPASTLRDSPPAAAPQDSSAPPTRRRRDRLRAAGAAGSLLPGQRAGPQRAAATTQLRAKAAEPQVLADLRRGRDVTSPGPWAGLRVSWLRATCGPHGRCVRGLRVPSCGGCRFGGGRLGACGVTCGARLHLVGLPGACSFPCE